MRDWPALLLEFPAPGGTVPPRTPLTELVPATLDGFDVLAVVEQPDRIWQVCFRDPGQRAAAAGALRARHGREGLRVVERDLPDEDWAARSQAALRAIQVGRIRVAPPWDLDGGPADGTATIVIEPAMGFGSGHHATTRLCLSALQRLDCRGRRVLDVGTGSGVLALAAAALGARAVLGVDDDGDALENARGNATLNGRPAAVEFLEADFRQAEMAPADVVLANLTGSLLADCAARLARLVSPDGSLVVSGITSGERDRVLAAFSGWGRAEWVAEEDGWCAAVLRIRKPGD